jgi:hypothetical protein
MSPSLVRGRHGLSSAVHPELPEHMLDMRGDRLRADVQPRCDVALSVTSGLGTFSIGFPPQYQNIDPTPEGLALGVNDTLDVCCWHDVFLTFPSFLDVLAFRGGTQEAAAVGGQEVVLIPREPTTVTLDPPADENPVGTQHCVTATVRDQFGEPMEGVVVRFSVTGSVMTSGSATTDAIGWAGP